MIRSGCRDGWRGGEGRVRTEDVGGELAEADVAAAARLAVVENAGHEGVLVEGDGGHDGE